jgi:hypothetical protein
MWVCHAERSEASLTSFGVTKVDFICGDINNFLRIVDEAFLP